MPKLVVTIGGKWINEYDVQKTPFIFGRGEGIDLSLNTPFLSRQHGRIVQEEGRYVVEDLGSTNGTQVNGAAVTRKALADDDVIHVGDVRIRFLESRAAPAADPLGRLAQQADADSVENVMQTYSLKMGPAAKQQARPGAPAPPALVDAGKASRMFFTLLQVSKDLGNAANMDDLVNLSMKLVFDVIAAERGVMYLLDPADGKLVPRIGYAKGKGVVDPRQFEVSSTILRRGVDEKAAILTSDAVADPRFAAGASIVKQSIRSVLCVPLWDEKEVYGAVYLDTQSRTYAFTEDDRALLTAISNLIAHRWRQERLRDKLKKEENLREVLSQYNSPDVVEMLVRGGGTLETTRREVTCLFVDLKDSTTMAERMEEADVYTFLNYFYDVTTDAVFRQKGHVNKYIGDAVLALFNAPMDVPDHEMKAVEAAREIVQKLREHNERQPDLPLNVRIGINTGIVIAGNVGQGHKEYTVLGDPVNTAERIMKVDRASPVALGEVTYLRIRDRCTAQDLGEMKVKGKDKAIRVYELVMAEPAQKPAEKG